MKNFKKVLALVLSVVMVVGTMTMAFGQTIVPAELYSDVTAEHETAVAKLKAVNVLDGYADGTIRLENTLTRAEVAKTIVALLGLAEGVDVNFPNTTTFADVNGHWAAGWISIATGQGIIKGHADGSFKPNDAVTEEQAIAMIVRALDWGPIVAGNYPYGENAKAMELGLVKKSPIYGNEATRGYVFAAAAEALTAPMAERKGTQGNITYEGEGIKTLLETRLGFKAVSEVIVDKTARMERELDTNEFQSGRTTFVYNNEDFDATEILGEVVNVWYDVNERTKDNEVIFVEVDPVDSTKITGVVTESKKNEIKLENGRTYKLEDVTVYVDNEETTTIPVGAYVSLTLDKKNNVVFVDAFVLTASDLTNALNLVTKINKVEDNRFEFYNQNDIRRDFQDEKLIVYKDGKLATTEDIQVNDLVKAIKLANQAKTTFVYVIGEATEAQELERVSVDGTAKLEDRKVTVRLKDGTVEEVDMSNFIIADTNFKGGTYGATSEKAFDEAVDALKDLLGKDVVLVTVPTGKVKAVIGKVDAKKVEAALTYQVGNKYSSYDKNATSVRFIDQANEKIDREFRTVDYDDTKIYVAKDISTEHTTTAMGNFATTASGDKVGKTTVFVGGTPKVDSNKLKVKDYYDEKDGKQAVDVENGIAVDKISNYTLKLKNKQGKNDIFNITDSTVIYNLKDDSEVYEAVKYADIKDSKVDGVEVVAIIDKDTENYATPTANVIVVTKGRFEAKDKDTQYGIVVHVSRGSDATYYTINDGDKDVEYAAAKDATFVSAGNTIQFSQTGKELKDLPEIKKASIKAGTPGNVTRIRGNVYTVGTTQYEVAPKFFSMNDGLFSDGKSNKVSYIVVDGKLRVLNFLRSDQSADIDGLADAKTFEGLTGYREAQFDGVKYEITSAVEQFLERNELALEGQKLVIAENTTLIRRIEGIELVDGSRTIDGMIAGSRFPIYGDVVVGSNANNRTLEGLDIEGKIKQYATTLRVINSKVNGVEVNAEGTETLTLTGSTVGKVVVNKPHTIKVNSGTTVGVIEVKAANVTIAGALNKVDKVVTTEAYAETLVSNVAPVNAKGDTITVTGNSKPAQKADTVAKATVTGDVYTVTIEMNKEIEVADKALVEVTTAVENGWIKVTNVTAKGKVLTVDVTLTSDENTVVGESLVIKVKAGAVKDLTKIKDEDGELKLNTNEDFDVSINFEDIE